MRPGDPIERLAGVANWIDRLSPAPLLYMQTASGVEVPDSRRGRRYWVVSRGLCRFFKVPLLPEAAAARQLDALELQIRRLSPFADPGSQVYRGAEFVCLWLWDQEAVRAAAAAVGVDIARLRVLPEPALHAPAADGVRLVATLDGVEAQSWVRGSLAASRWWPAMPDARAWMLFQRGASLPPAQVTAEPPAPLPQDWLPRPWTRSRSGAFDLGRIDMRLMAAGLGGLLLLGYGYVGAQWLRLSRDLAGVERAIAETARAASPVLQARAAALDNRAAIEQLSGLDRYPDQLAMMARVGEILPKNDSHLTDWDYESGKLDVTVAAGQRLDSLYFVRALEKIPGFKGVGAERAGSDETLRIRLTVEPK